MPAGRASEPVDNGPSSSGRADAHTHKVQKVIVRFPRTSLSSQTSPRTPPIRPPRSRPGCTGRPPGAHLRPPSRPAAAAERSLHVSRRSGSVSDVCHSRRRTATQRTSQAASHTLCASPPPPAAATAPPQGGCWGVVGMLRRAGGLGRVGLTLCPRAPGHVLQLPLRPLDELEEDVLCPVYLLHELVERLLCTHEQACGLSVAVVRQVRGGSLRHTPTETTSTG